MSATRGIICLIVVAVLCVKTSRCTDRPIIGILTMEMESSNSNSSLSYIAASYVKAVEAAGARVAPIFLNRSMAYYKDQMHKLNGLVLPGGNAPFGTEGGYFETVARLVSIVKQMSDPLPILGVCQGFEALAYVTNNMDPSTLTKCTGTEGVMLPLHFTEGFRNSGLYRDASAEIIETLSTRNVTPNYHQWCITPNTLSKIKEPWRILSTNVDAGGMQFVSSMESGTVVGIQFHPEKCAYEWEQNNPSYKEALVAARHFYDWLVTEARRNNNSFPSEQEEKQSLIYNYCPKVSDYFEQAYYF